MIDIIKTVLIITLIQIANAFTPLPNRYNFLSRSVSSTTKLNEVPLELTGQLDPSKSWDVKFIFRDQEKTVSISEGTSVLEKAEKTFKGVQSSCRNGVCTTCCGKIEEGKTNTKLAVHGLGEPQIDAGFVCTCQTYVTGPGVVIRLDQADEVYETQYGQFEKSYGELKFAKKN